MTIIPRITLAYAIENKVVAENKPAVFPPN
jgi:hypothetical protein